MTISTLCCEIANVTVKIVNFKNAATFVVIFVIKSKNQKLKLLNCKIDTFYSKRNCFVKLHKNYYFFSSNKNKNKEISQKPEELFKLE